MTTLFADTFYFIALLSPADAAHSKSIEITRQFNGRLLTTAWVLTEIADGLVEPRARSRFLQFYDRLRSSDEVEIVASNSMWFDRGMDLYRSRADTGWSLTDCISFVVMERYQVSEALTADHHFEQAGFIALLK
jgi:predicted nucleic acid-binding protein